MTTSSEPPPPAWVRKRDGRLVPFEADRISRVLFAASETAGRADPFLTRELADAVVHFLAEEAEGAAPPTTERIAEVVLTVLREFSQFDLIEAIQEHDRQKRRAEPRSGRVSPAQGRRQAGTVALETLWRDWWRACSLQQVFSRDLAAAHQDDMILLGGLEHPGEVSACLVGPFRPGGLIEALAEAATFAGEVLVLEGVEQVLARLWPLGEKIDRARLEAAAEDFLRELTVGARLIDRRIVLNLNVARPPAWAESVDAGPLFAEPGAEEEAARVAELGLALIEAFPGAPAGRERIRLDWHLSARDFKGVGRERLMPAARACLAGEPLAFVCDRPRQPVWLAEGIDRRNPAVLLGVGLYLPRLARLVGDERLPPGSDENEARCQRFLKRLPSLVRLALSAGMQKRFFLRQRAGERPSLARGFLLERARLVVAPLGLDEAVERMTGRRIAVDARSQEFASRVLQRLREVLRQEARESGLEGCVDALPVSEVAEHGPTCWDRAAPVREQLRACGALHAVLQGGTAVILLPGDGLAGVEQLIEWLSWGWTQKELTRFRFVKAPESHRQLTFGEEGERV